MRSISSKKLRSGLAATAVIFSLLGLVACGGAAEQELVAEAKSLIAKKDLKGAVVTLKAALQRFPNSGEARYTLGQALLEGGEIDAAIIELNKAIELQFEQNLVIPSLASAMLRAGQEKKLLEQFSNTTLTQSKSIADLKTSLSWAHLRQGTRDGAAASLEAALLAAPDYEPARLLQARWKAGERDFDGALVIADGVIAKNTQAFQAWQVKGDVLLYGKSDQTSALVAYRKALEIEPKFLPAHAAIIALMMKTHDMAGLQSQLNSLKKALPDSRQAVFFEAQQAFLQKDLKRSRELVQQLMKFSSDEVRLLQLAGAIELQGGNVVQAEAYLTKALHIIPELPLARRLLAQVYLRNGAADKAFLTLAPLLKSEDPGADTLALAAEAMLVKGNNVAAEQYFVRALKYDPTDVNIRTAVVLARFEKDTAETGLGELEAIARTDGGTVADMALINARVRRNDSAGALLAVEALEQKLPGNPLPHHLRGRILVGKGDASGARASFERAAAVDPMYFPSVSSLAAMDQAAKMPEMARHRFESMLKADPKHIDALLALAELHRWNDGTPEEVIGLLRRATSAAPSDAGARILLIDYLISKRRFNEALSAAQDASTALPDNLKIIASLGRAQLISGETEQAIGTFRKLVAKDPKSAEPLLRLAAAYLATKNREEATKAYRRALEVAPQSALAQASLIALALDGQRPEEARLLARAIQRKHEKQAAGWVYEGDVEFSQRNYAQAAAAYRIALSKEAATDIAIKLHRALLRANLPAEASRLAADRLKASPRDGRLQMYLGDVALLDQDLKAAEQHYRAAMSLQPLNGLAANNLAFVTIKQGKAGSVELARKADQLMPNKPIVLDTLAMALAFDGQFASAVDVQNRAIDLSPTTPSLKLNLARIHLQSGDKEKARTLLVNLSALGNNFSGQPEVLLLLQSIQ